MPASALTGVQREISESRSMVLRLYDNPRALTSGLSTVQADKPCSILLVA